MKQGSITIKDIAKALNLSHSTVARALKGSYKISLATTQKVKEFAETNGYIPNLMAQSLKSQNSRTIGIMLCSIPNSFFAEVINGIESVASNRDYYVIISQSHESYEKEVRNLKYLESRQIDGLLVSVSAETKDITHFKEFHDKKIPLVFFDRISDDILTHKVVSDNFGGAFDLTSNLIDNGYKKIAHITSSPMISITQDRLEGYKQALIKNGFPVNDDYIKYCMHGGRDIKEVEVAIEELFSLDDTPDALFTGSDRLTIASLGLLKQRGEQIPTNIGIGGFSNFSSPELFNPPVTTVSQSAFEMGKVATELLIQLIESKRPVKEFEKIVLPVHLTVRESTCKINHPLIHSI